MANRSEKLGAYHGGLNDNTDARDLQEDEIAGAKDCAVNRVGRVSVIGGEDSALTNLDPANIKPSDGYGLFFYSTDVDSDGERKSEDWITFYDSQDGKVKFYKRDKANGSASPNLVSTIEDTWSEDDYKGKVEPNFFLADGILRYSDGNFDTTNPNRVHQFVDNKLFRRNSAQTTTTVACVTQNNSSTVTAHSSGNFSAIVTGMEVSGTGIPSDETVVVESIDTSTDPDTLVISQSANGASSNTTLTFVLKNVITRKSWVNSSQALKSFDDINTSLTLDNSQAEGPDDTAVGNSAGNLVLSYWTGTGDDNGNWNGSFTFAASPIYHQGGVGPISEFDGVTNFHNDLVAFQLHITLGTSIDDDAHPFGDDRITGVRVWFRSHGADKWHKLKDFDMKKGGKHRWETYDGSTNKAYGIFNGSISDPTLTATDTDPDPDIVESYKETTMSFTITNSASGFSGRKGFIRVWGVYNEPQWLNTFNGNPIDLGATSQAYTMTVTTPAVGTREFRVELLDESFNVLVKSNKTDILITDTGGTPPPTYSDDTDSS